MNYRVFCIEYQKNPTNVNYWTSGTDQGSEGEFYWSTTGHNFSYTSWAVKQPNNEYNRMAGEYENCVALQAESEFRWDDRPCNEVNYFICRNATNPSFDDEKIDMDLYSNLIL